MGEIEGASRGNGDIMTRSKIADAVIFSGMLINAVVIVLILYFYVF